MGASIRAQLGQWFDPSMSLEEMLARVRFTFEQDQVIGTYQECIDGLQRTGRRQMVISGGEVYIQLAEPADREKVAYLERELQNYIAGKYPISLLGMKKYDG